MQENELEEMAEKTLASGEMCTIAKDKKLWVVDMWSVDGENKWNRYFESYETAKAEYDRW